MLCGIYLKDSGLFGAGDMGDAIEINGVKYKVKRMADKITLQRYNERYKMWVNLHFPKRNEIEGKKIEEDILQILSSQYIERNAKAVFVQT